MQHTSWAFSDIVIRSLMPQLLYEPTLSVSDRQYSHSSRVDVWLNSATGLFLSSHPCVAAIQSVSHTTIHTVV